MTVEELVSFKNYRYPIAKLESKIPSEEAQVLKEIGSVRSNNYTIAAKVGEYTASISYTINGMLGKCTCGQYDDEPCEHIVAVWQVMKSKLGNKLEKLKKIEESMYGDGQKDSEEGSEGATDVPETAETSSLKDRFKGKLTVLFGEPLVGKTTFAMHVAKQFKHKVVIHIDKNYDVRDYLPDAKVYEVSEPIQVLEAISKTPAYEDTIVIVDSITSLDSFFIGDPTKDDPRVANRRMRFCDAVMLRLQKFKSHGAVIVIAHEAIKNFQTKEVGPRMNKVALRHADQILRMVVENGKRKVKLVAKREKVVSPDVQFEWE